MFVKLALTLAYVFNGDMLYFWWWQFSVLLLDTVFFKDMKLCTTNWDDLVLCKCSEKQSSTYVFWRLQELSQHLLLRRAQGGFITTDLEDHPKQSSEVWERKTKTHIKIVSISLQHQQHITNYVAEQTWVCTSIWTY
jgi:hypothetical protein